MQLGTPIIALIQESLILLLKMPQLISGIRFKFSTQLGLSPEETAFPQEVFKLTRCGVLGGA